MRVDQRHRVPPDTADEAVPLYVDWGRPRTDGLPPVPRIVPGKLEWAFPRHSWQCLAYNGGRVDALRELSRRRVGPGLGVRLHRAGLRDLARRDPVRGQNVLLAAAAREAGPPRRDDPLHRDRRADVHAAIDRRPDPGLHDRGPDRHAHARPVGDRGVAEPGGRRPRHAGCGSRLRHRRCHRLRQGGVACTTSVPGGTTVRLAALESEAGLAKTVAPAATRPSGRAALVTVNGPRVVHAFGWLRLRRPVETTDGRPLRPARKAEIASNGADAALDGAVGCGLTAALIGTASGSSVIVAGTAGAATRFNALVQQAFEETVGNCATGLAGTIYNGLLLKIDPPRSAVAEGRAGRALPRAAVTPCRPRRRALRRRRSRPPRPARRRRPPPGDCRRPWPSPPTATATR